MAPTKEADMLRGTKDLDNYKISATDGEIGHAKDYRHCGRRGYWACSTVCELEV